MASQTNIFAADINAKPQEVDLELNHTISLQLNDLGNSRLNYLNFQSYYILETINPYLQLELFSTTFPNEPRVVDNEEITYFEYSLQQNPKEEVEFSSIFSFTSTPNYPKITQKINYPIVMSQYSSNEIIEEFTQLTPQINTNAQLQQKALELAQGEDDVLAIATKIANWVQQEIEYDLSTVFENPDQNAVEIFQSKQGVCKELSIVYASMLRSLGIPVRINSGFAYTTSEEIVELVGDNWGGHAWTEVLIGDEWVPFDLTYQQYGYVDSSHIPLQQSVDMEDLGVRVEMSSNNIEIVPNSLDSNFDFQVNSLTELDSSFTDIKAQLSINPTIYQSDSSIIVNATIENNENHYQLIPIEIAYPDEMIAIEDTFKIMILPPYSSKTQTFFLKMPSNMQGYSFPIALYTKSSQYELQDEVAVSQRRNGIFISEAEIENLQEKLQNKNIAKNSSLSITNESSNFNPNNLEDNNSISTSTNSLTQELIRTNLEEFDFNEQCRVGSIKSMNQYEIKCNLSNILEDIELNNIEIENIELCSGLNCNTLTNIEQKIINITTSPDLLTQLKINSISKQFTLKNSIVPKIDIEYEINNSQVLFKNNLNDSTNNFKVKVIIGNREISFNSNENIEKVYFDEGNYIAIIQLYYKNELVNHKKISFTITQKNIIEKISEQIQKFLNI